MAEVAAKFAQHRALAAAWQQWGAWMELQQLRRQRLAALLAILDGGAASSKQHLSHCWQRWRQAVQQGQRQAALADELAGRRAAALMAQVLDVWAAYARAMQAEPDPGSPFASPRAAGEDAALVSDLAELVAGGRGSSEESDGSTSSSSGSSRKTTDGGTVPGHTSITVAAAGSPGASMAASATPVGEAGGQQEQRRRWRLGVRLFRSTR